MGGTALVFGTVKCTCNNVGTQKCCKLWVKAKSSDSWICLVLWADISIHLIPLNKHERAEIISASSLTNLSPIFMELAMCTWFYQNQNKDWKTVCRHSFTLHPWSVNVLYWSSFSIRYSTGIVFLTAQWESARPIISFGSSRLLKPFGPLQNLQRFY